MSDPALGLSLPGVRVLLVGTGSHDDETIPDVPAVKATVDDLGRELVERCGLMLENLRTLLDPVDPQVVRIAIDQAAREAEDVLMFYYVGHGLVGNDVLYLATKTTNHLTEGLGAKALPYSFVLETLRNCRARSIVVVLDCCFSGRAEVFERLVSDPFAMAGVDGRYLLASAAPDEMALAPNGQRYTTFTGELLRLLTEGDPRLPRELRLEHVYELLSWKLPRERLPEPRRYLSGGVGKLVLARNPVAGTPSRPERPDGPPITAAEEMSPYRGLAPFDVNHADYFYGRESLTAELIQRLGERLADAGPLVVIGPSGSGKSSLLQAGLVPALWRGELGVTGSSTWPCHTITPGEHPLETLATRFGGNGTRSEITEHLLVEPDLFAGYVQRWLQKRSAGIARPGRRLVLIVDQFEEAFTACQDERERMAFFGALVTACTYRGTDRPEDNEAGPPALVVLSVRADFYGDCLKYSQLLPVLQAGQVLVGPMSESELRDAIEKPAAAVNLGLEGGLVDRLLEDLSDGYRSVEAAGGALPLLSFALMATWGQRVRFQEGQLLTLAGYQATGGIREAVANKADQVYDGLDPEEQGIARRLLLRMVRVGDGTEDTRRRVDLEVLRQKSGTTGAQAIDRVSKKFADARLVTLDQDHAQITHEALLHAWPRLRQWIDADRAGLLIHQQLTEATKTWLLHDRDPSALLRGPRLTVTTEWAAESDVRATSLTPDEQAFLDASITLHNQEQTATAIRARRRKQTIAALLVLLIGSLVATGLAIHQNSIATHQRQVAEDRLNEAQSRQIAAVSNEQRDTWPIDSQLLTAAAWRNAPTEQARSALLATQTRPLRYILKGHTEAVQSIAFSPDGKTLATGGRDKTVRLWDINTGKPIGEPLLHGGFVAAITFTRDGQYLLTGTSEPDNTAQQWLVRTHKPVGQPTKYQTPVFNIKYSPDGRTFVFNTGIPILTDDLTSKVIGSLKVQHALTVDVQFSADGTMIATSGTDKMIRLWRAADLRNILTIPTYYICRRIALSPDGSTVACPDANLTVGRWNTSTGQPVGPTIRGRDFAQDVAFGPHGSVLASADRNVHLWYSGTDELIRNDEELIHTDSVSEVEFSPDGGTLASADVKGTVAIWQPLLPFASGTSEEFSISCDGWTVAFRDNNGGVRVWDVARRKPKGQPLTCDAIRPDSGVALSPNGQRLAVACNGELRVLDTQTGRQVASLGESPSDFNFSPDGLTLAVTTLTDCAGAACGRLALFDAETSKIRGQPLWDAVGWPMTPTNVQFSEDGERLATASYNGEVRMWDVRRREQIGSPLTGHTDPITKLAFSPDGHTLATSSTDFTIRRWNLDTYREIGSPLTGPTSTPISLSFSPDGTLLASAGWDHVVRVWGTIDAAPYATLSEDRGIEYVQFADNGDLVGLGGYNVAARWSTDPNTALERLCSRLPLNLNDERWDRLVPGVPYTPQCQQ